MIPNKATLMLAAAATVLPLQADAGNPVEPNAGNWRTWVISSGRDYRAPPPPGAADTQAELHALDDLIGQNDAQALQRIAFWDAGSPAYRWIDLITARLTAGTPTTAFPHRVYTYVALAMHDATIATWESKYAYNRPRPSERNHKLPAGVAMPDSPSYPSEHAATAQAAAAVLAYFLPAEAQSFQAMTEQAGWSRVLAGVQYPSDYYAGLALGRKVAEQVIAKAKADGSDAVWTGTVPTGPCKWLGSNPPANVTAPNWKTLLLSSPGQFRPPPPPACDSPQVVAEVATVHNFPRSVPGTAAIFATNYKAFYWQSPEGINTWPYRYADKWIAEDRLDHNPPRRRGRTRSSRACTSTPSSRATTRSSLTGTSGRASSIRVSRRCFRCRTIRAILRITRRFRRRDPKSSRTCFPHAPISFAQ